MYFAFVIVPDSQFMIKPVTCGHLICELVWRSDYVCHCLREMCLSHRCDFDGYL